MKLFKTIGHNLSVIFNGTGELCEETVGAIIPLVRSGRKVAEGIETYADEFKADAVFDAAKSSRQRAAELAEFEAELLGLEVPTA